MSAQNIHRQGWPQKAKKFIFLFLPLGRINRLTYLLCTLFLGTFAVLATLAMASFFELAYVCDTLSLIFLLYFICFWCFGMACLGVYLFFIFTMKRLHDFSESGYWAILLFAPLINLFLATYLLLMPGDESRNPYGFPPE